MPAKDKHNPDELLKHLPEYGVVICKACQFAVQPQALPSHLLRHQIYRNERRTLLNRLSKLGLRDPDDVPTPDPNAPPLASLPLHNGYVCLAGGCSHSCVSQKRMFQHWSEAHGEHDSKNVRARPAALQTFFRGNKIRYFEVNGAYQVPTPDSHPSSQAGDEKSPAGFRQLASPPPPSLSDEGEPVPDTIPTLDMQVLRYFRHYTVSPSLVPHRGERETERFWAETIYEEALKHDFLMYGILGVSAISLASQAKDMETCQIHRAAAIRYQSAGTTAFCEAMKHPDTTNSTALIAYARYNSVHRVMMELLEDKLSVFGGAQRVHNDLSSVVQQFFMLRGGVELLLGLQHLLPYGSDFILGEEDTHSVHPSENIEALERDVMRSMHVPPAFYNRLDALPRRLAELNAIQDANESQAIAGAVTALIVGASRSFAADGVTALWVGMETFTKSVPDHFARMMEICRPAALVVFAHWLPLLNRLEFHYTNTRGQAARLLKIIRSNLSPDLVPLLAELELVT